MPDKAQRGELRVVLKFDDGRTGLAWSATLKEHDIYAGSSNHLFDFSYHASGKGHVHGRQRRDRIIMPPSVPVGQIMGHQKVGGFPIDSAALGYTPKPDTPYRKTAILNAPLRNSVTIDFWLLEAGRPDLADTILQNTFRAHNLDVFGVLHLTTTAPQMFAVVWSFSAAVWERTIQELTEKKIRDDFRMPERP